jgi:hypothetical protein
VQAGLLWIVACAVFALPTLGHAVGPDWKVVTDSPKAFAKQAAEVRKEMGPRGAYGGISGNERTAVNEDLDKIAALLKERGSVSQLNDSEQVDLMNAQERINAVLTRNEGNRLICTMEQRLGTNFKHKVCRTQAEIDGIRRNSQEGFQNSLMKGSATQQKPPAQGW